MKPDSNLVQYRQITRGLESRKLVTRSPGSSRSRDVIVAATLLALLVVAVVSRATIADEIADSNVGRQSLAAFVIDVVATLGLSVGLAWLLFSSRPRADDERARS